MSNLEQQLEEVELSIEQAQAMIDKRNSLERLTKNEDFKKIILDNYFVDEASRLVLLKADDEMQAEANQADVMRQIDAIGNFRRYLSGIMQLGNMAARELESHEGTREEILQEQINE